MQRIVVVFAALLALSLTLLPGCSATQQNSQPSRVEIDIPAVPNRDLDLLFVIDDSASMRDKQLKLKAGFAKFVDVLAALDGGLPSIHIGVVTSDLGTKGTQDTVPGPTIAGRGGCAGEGKTGNLQTYGTPLVVGNFIRDTQNADGTRSKNYTGSLAEAFSAIATAGDSGCFIEQHLEAAKRALDGNAANAGFLRPNAYLAIVFVADEDDCSLAQSALLASDAAALGPRNSFRCTRLGITCDDGGADSTAMAQAGRKRSCHANNNSPYLTKIDDYVAFFKGLKPDDPNKVVVAGIMGTPEPFEVELRAPRLGDPEIPQLAHSCSYTNSLGQPEVADPPIRIKQFLDSFSVRSVARSICDPDLSDGLTQVGQLLASALPAACIDSALADMDPNTEGPQYDCEVVEIASPGDGTQSKTPLPACNNPNSSAESTNKPCWTIGTSAQRCTAKQHQLLTIERTQDPAPDTRVVARCATCTDADNDGICDP